MCSQFGGSVPRERSAHACSGDRGRKSVSQIDAVLPHYLALRLNAVLLLLHSVL